MALGFGFNKVKVLNSAERYVQQGKLQNAIGEYEKVARHDPRDLTVLNTIGDLYARLGQIDRATAHFRKVGDAYAADGFVVKAIAMYKKVTKLASNSTEALQKLAELYTQQGLYNDARQQYVAVADQCLRANDLEAAARVFQKMLELDPENAAMQSRVAELYLRLGKKEEARDIYVHAAESLYQRAALEAADEALGRVLALDPSNARALLRRAQIAMESGDAAAALQHLGCLPDLDNNPDALSIALRARLQAGKAAEAEQAARDLAARHRDLRGIEAMVEWLVAGGAMPQALALCREYSEQFARESPEKLERVLETCLRRVKDDVPSLEMVRELYGKLNDKAQVNECTELLAHALVQAGDLQRARDLYRELSESEPENPIHQQHYRQVLARLGEDAAVRPLTQEEGSRAFMVDELEMSSPAVTQEYADDLAETINSALTDAELLDSYNLSDKAVAKLESVLPKAPRDVRVNQRLASLYAQAGRFEDAAHRCAVLESVYLEAGFAELAGQYREMSAKYHERASSEPPAQPATESEGVTLVAEAAADSMIEAEPPAPVSEGEPAAVTEAEVEAAPAGEHEAAPEASQAEAESGTSDLVAAEEIDLSEEWETHAASEPSTAAPDLAGLQAQIAAASAHAPEVKLESPADELGIAGWEQTPPRAPEGESPVSAPQPSPAGLSAEAAEQASAESEDALRALVSDLEESLGDDFGEAPAGTPASVMPSAVPTASGPAAAAQTTPAAAAAPAQPEEETVSPLADMFAEFKEDAEAGGEQLQDPETHYNLGVAFREMGLMDEAIGELQKVCAAIDEGAEFPHVMQAYTWLAHCFLEKGVPEASFKWYERALKIATDEQQRMSLHYDLASAYEAAGNRSAALQHFLEVYGSNIDFRDVAERIKALRS